MVPNVFISVADCDYATGLLNQLGAHISPLFLCDGITRIGGDPAFTVFVEVPDHCTVMVVLLSAIFPQPAQDQRGYAPLLHTYFRMGRKLIHGDHFRLRSGVSRSSRQTGCALPDPARISFSNFFTFSDERIFSRSAFE